MACYGVNFHYFHGGIHPKSQGSISAEQLERLIVFLGRENILGAREWLVRALAGKLRSNDLCLTFDDGLRGQFDIALPVLESYGITAFFFIYSSPFEGAITPLEIYRYFRTTRFENIDQFYKNFEVAVENSPYAGLVFEALRAADSVSYMKEYDYYSIADRRFRYLRDKVLGDRRYFEIMERMIEEDGKLDRQKISNILWMNDDCLRELARRGHQVGLHSYSHPTQIDNCDIETQRKEYTRNREHLHRVLGTLPESMSHPCSLYNEDTFIVLRELGIKIGFRDNILKKDGGMLELPRQDQFYLIKEMENG